MISLKELDYVNSWANRVPHPGSVYTEEAVNKTLHAFKMFNDRYKGAKLDIIFSNNEELEFEIMAKNICHMLGIDYQNLKGDFWAYKREDVLGIDRNENLQSYDFLTRFLEKIDKVLEYDNDPKNTAKMINYYKLSIKADIFNKLENIFTGDFGCINFDQKKYATTEDKAKKFADVSKFFYFGNDEAVCPYFMLGLVKDGYEVLENNFAISDVSVTPYVVQTAFAPVRYGEMFDGQEVVIPVQVMTDKDSKLTKQIITPDSKLKILDQYGRIISDNKLTSNIDIFGDYKRTLLEDNKGTQYKK